MVLLFAAAGMGILFLAHTAPFPFLIDRLAGDRAIWHLPGDPATPTVYLTYDDGPNPEATPALLDVLAATGARATFFLIERHVTTATAPMVRRMADEGHAVALHSHTRRWMTLAPTELAAALGAAAARIEHVTGVRPCRAFRPHAGWRGGEMYAGVAQAGYALVGWGWMLWDWNWGRRRTADSVVRRVLRRVGPGDIVVVHDGHHKNPRADRRYGVEATAQLVPALKARGFVFGTICP